MFIERARSKRSSSLQRSETRSVLRTIQETLRSAGARVVFMISFYKHFAPLEPGPLVYGQVALCNLCGSLCLSDEITPKAFTQGH
jgi:hypothetical protein